MVVYEQIRFAVTGLLTGVATRQYNRAAMGAWSVRRSCFTYVPQTCSYYLRYLKVGLNWAPLRTECKLDGTWLQYVTNIALCKVPILRWCLTKVSGSLRQVVVGCAVTLVSPLPTCSGNQT